MTVALVPRRSIGEFAPRSAGLDLERDEAIAEARPARLRDVEEHEGVAVHVEFECAAGVGARGGREQTHESDEHAPGGAACLARPKLS